LPRQMIVGPLGSAAAARTDDNHRRGAGLQLRYDPAQFRLVGL
jgi:hypothetical protein